MVKRNFGWRVQVDANNEIGELGQAINIMDEKLAEYDQMQKQFFQNASHDLKSPLMSIQGYAEGIRGSGDSAGRRIGIYWQRLAASVGSVLQRLEGGGAVDWGCL